MYNAFYKYVLIYLFKVDYVQEEARQNECRNGAVRE